MASAAPHLARIAAHETHDLRHRVLRPHQSPAEMVYGGDDDARAVHVGASAAPGSPWLAIATITPQHGAGWTGDDVWRLRGMAVDATAQRTGLGAALLAFGIAEAHAGGARRLWCNARATAVAFYARAGWNIVSDEFDIPGIGPHFVMVRELGDTPPDEAVRPHAGR